MLHVKRRAFFQNNYIAPGNKMNFKNTITLNKKYMGTNFDALLFFAEPSIDS